MSDKVQKIREWVKARLDENASKQSLPQFYGMMEEDARFLDFLDSLQAEPVSGDLEKEIQTTIKMVKYLDLSIDDIVLFCAHHYSNWQKEQMQKDAKESEVVITSKGILLSDLRIEDFDYKDKVKVIIIKED